MGLFDGAGELSITGDYAASPPAYDFSSSFWESSDSIVPHADVSMWGSPTLVPDGSNGHLLAQNTSTSWWDYDQAKISAPVQDVLGSLIQAGAKSAVQIAQKQLEKGTMNKNETIAGWFQNFQSTKTGAQVNAASYATKFENYFYNPMLWFGAIGLVVLFFFMRK